MLYHGPLVQNIMVVYGMMCTIAVTTPGDVGREEDVTHLKIREHAEHVKEELAGVAGRLTFTLTLTVYDALDASLSHLVGETQTVFFIEKGNWNQTFFITLNCFLQICHQSLAGAGFYMLDFILSHLVVHLGMSFNGFASTFLRKLF